MIGPSALATDPKEKLTTETQRTQSFKARKTWEIRTFNRRSQRSRRQTKFSGGLADSLFVAFVIFCERRCFDRGFMGFIGGLIWVWGSGIGWLDGLTFDDFKRHLALASGGFGRQLIDSLEYHF
jgi:hypothetical protein